MESGQDANANGFEWRRARSVGTGFDRRGVDRHRRIWRHTRFGRIERATQRRRAITRQIVEIPRRKIGISAAAQRARQGLVYDKAAAAAAATARPSVALVALGDCARPARQRHGHG